MSDQAAVDSFLALSAGVMVVAFIWGVIAYLFTAFALYKMGRNQGFDDAFFAFIPVLNYKTWGDLLETKAPDFLKPQTGWKVFGVFIALIILNLIPLLNIIAVIAGAVLGVWMLYALLDRYTVNAGVWTVVHIITGCFFFPIHLFVIRNNQPR
ncbi:hypothetical protein [Bacillus sp. 165]|uniref:hypothetical protein n=1 Tax=Bacillus sp. 165 TaxID=1529117 RepID=UPI001ADC9C67|nr:hypothetical protein [Bacillus sp. 165]MBO9130664.1 hypothetical protein [Bacillus sp. 165]